MFMCLCARASGRRKITMEQQRGKINLRERRYSDVDAVVFRLGQLSAIEAHGERVMTSEGER